MPAETNAKRSSPEDFFNLMALNYITLDFGKVPLPAETLN